MSVRDLPSDGKSVVDLCNRALACIDELRSIVGTLSQDRDPSWAALVRRRATEVLKTSPGEEIVNAMNSLPAIDTIPAGIAVPGYLQATREELRSLLSPREIKQSDLRNRNRKSKLCTDVILLLLLANETMEITFDDAKFEFSRLGIPETPTSLASRLSRMRTDGFLVPVSESGGGVYKLSQSGRAAATAAKSTRAPQV
jgi:hypothetical protein